MTLEEKAASGTPRASWRPLNEVFHDEGQEPALNAAVERERTALGGEVVALLAPPLRFWQALRNWGALDQLSPLMASSSSTM